MDQKLEKIYCRRPHIVIVGAGASAAVMGNKCPTMSNAIDVLGLNSLLNNVSLKTKSKNLEDIYSELFNRGEECRIVRKKMEDALYSYFSSIHLPSNITIYDLLILALKENDCIISFNWDSLLIEAYNRVSKITHNRPEILFLHGNVGAGICESCKTFGPIQNHCPKCGKPFKRVSLLYPVKKKDYNKDVFIRDQWSAAKDYLSRAGKVTIFGYSAPSSDQEASEILKTAFSKYTNVHMLDSIEIIERPNFDSSEISDTWKYFFELTNYHYDIVHSFYESSLASSPRRTIQYQYRQFIEGWWGSPTVKFSGQSTFESVSKDLKQLLENERNNDFSII